MIAKGMPKALTYFGGMPRNACFKLPARHLGLLPAAEVADLDARLSAAADAIGQTGLAGLPAAVDFQPEPSYKPAAEFSSALQGMRIGIAADAAFSFLYQANLDLLRAMGSQLQFFSPLADARLPDVDSVYLPCGYPELHLQALQDNRSMHQALRRHHNQGRPIYAECGGMLYLLDTLTDAAGQSARMAGLLRGDADQATRARLSIGGVSARRATRPHLPSFRDDQKYAADRAWRSTAQYLGRRSGVSRRQSGCRLSACVFPVQSDCGFVQTGGGVWLRTSTPCPPRRRSAVILGLLLLLALVAFLIAGVSGSVTLSFKNLGYGVSQLAHGRPGMVGIVLQLRL